MIPKREQYISNMELSEAKQLFFAKARDFQRTPKKETISVGAALGRITLEPIYACLSSPHYNAAAMDGIVVKSEDTIGASEVHPLTLIKETSFQYVNTGNLIEPPFDAVIMIEDVIIEDENTVRIIAAAHPWQHIRPVGEDIVAGEMIIPSFHEIRPADIGALISGGIETLNVIQKPRVGILPTGSELVESVADLKAGKIIESNTHVFEALANEAGAEAHRYSPCPDDYDFLKKRILTIIKENDILVINAGASAGTKDYTVKILREIGDVVVHGIAIKPAKPTILAFLDQKPVIGLPGYPVSSYLSFTLFVTPLITMLLEKLTPNSMTVTATLAKRIVSSLKYQEFVRVSLGRVGERLVATPLIRGAGITMSLVKADGLLSIPKAVEGLDAGADVNIRLIKPLRAIESALVSIGSHDLIMDELADMLPLSSGHVGSMGGIMAIKRDECHLAPVHLLDEKTGDYNVAYVKRYLKEKKVALIRGVKRYQGFIVQKGNPLNIKGIQDLVRPDIHFVNRQKGSGTRILLDYTLKKEKIDSEAIKGYEREMITHMSVAICIKSGSAQTGLGVQSAAMSMGLDFIPLGFEHYDFIVPLDYMDDPKINHFIQTLKSEAFHRRVFTFKGYEIDNIGEVIYKG